MNKIAAAQARAWRGPGMVLALAAMAAGCVSSPTPDQMSRTTKETAPADLQLLCASEAARSRNIDGGSVLPTGSSKIDSKTYQVELNAGGTPMLCTVDSDGVVSSVRSA
jgi:hypothetical protein